MLDDYRDQQRNRIAQTRSLMFYAMGIFLIFIGLCFIFYNQFGLQKIFRKEHSALDYIIGAVFILYGIWRIYRGYKKVDFK